MPDLGKDPIEGFDQAFFLHQRSSFVGQNRMNGFEESRSPRLFPHGELLSDLIRNLSAKAAFHEST